MKTIKKKTTVRASVKTIELLGKIEKLTKDIEFLKIESLEIRAQAYENNNYCGKIEKDCFNFIDLATQNMGHLRSTVGEVKSLINDMMSKYCVKPTKSKWSFFS